MFLRANLDWDDGRMKYEVEFYSGTTEYDYDYRRRHRRHPQLRSGAGEFQIWNNGTSRPPGTATLPAVTISPQSGPTDRPGGDAQLGSTVVKCQFDWDDGRAQYEVKSAAAGPSTNLRSTPSGTIFSRDIDNDRW